MWLIFTSRINLSFNTQVQRFTCLHGITAWFQSLQEANEQSVSKASWCGVCQGGASGRLYFKFMLERFLWTEVCSLSSSGIPDAVALSAFSQVFAVAAWDVMLQSSWKITIINIGSFAVSQKNQALSKLYHYKAQWCRRAVESPSVFLPHGPALDRPC